MLSIVYVNERARPWDLYAKLKTIKPLNQVGISFVYFLSSTCCKILTIKPA